MKTNLISVIKKSFDGLELLDFAKSGLWSGNDPNIQAPKVNVLEKFGE